MEGGVWTGGRHTRGSGFVKDCDKYNRAAELGWLVLRYTAEHLKDHEELIGQVARVLEKRSDALQSAQKESLEGSRGKDEAEDPRESGGPLLPLQEQGLASQTRDIDKG